MNTLTLDDIKRIHENAYQECIEVFPVEKWAHKYSPETQIVVSSHVSDYAKAHVEAEKTYISIHALFLASSFPELVRKTAIHEFTHFIVGIDQHHNAKFKRVESYLLDKLHIDHEKLEAEREEFLSLLSFKWTVIAILLDGTEVYIGGVHRKTKKYADYPRSEKEIHRIAIGEHRGRKVAKYKFIQNR